METSREYRERRFWRIEFLEISIPKNQILTVSQIIVNNPLSHKHTPFCKRPRSQLHTSATNATLRTASDSVTRSRSAL